MPFECIGVSIHYIPYLELGLEMSLNIIFRLRYIMYPTHDDYGFPTKVDSVTCTQNSKEIYRTRFLA